MTQQIQDHQTRLIEQAQHIEGVFAKLDLMIAMIGEQLKTCREVSAEIRNIATSIDRQLNGE